MSENMGCYSNAVKYEWSVCVEVSVTFGCHWSHHNEEDGVGGGWGGVPDEWVRGMRQHTTGIGV